MSEPLKIRFGTDISSAKAGLTNLAASVVADVGLVSTALNKDTQAQSGYGQAVAKVARAVGDDYAAMTAAGLKAANDTEGSAVARAAGQTNVASAAITTSLTAGSRSGSGAIGGIVPKRVRASRRLDRASQTSKNRPNLIPRPVARPDTLDHRRRHIVSGAPPIYAALSLQSKHLRADSSGRSLDRSRR
ncbi:MULTISPECIES: hypothetical protein [Methylobacterium]|uniref:hypothetical protein n=1 Tax=Methylobacterium TaxID=407 RepID=UPI0013EC451D|nr:hypothetical protein [Methylobacterium sp. DB0501]NGM35498.1 hypothetical protein [Methylobacterium sp. DB0501]